MTESIVSIEGTREALQWVRVLAALSEDLGLVPNIHMVAPNHLNLLFQGSNVLF